MSDDLIGRKLTIADKEWEVKSPANWSGQYVILERPSDGDGMEDRKDMILRPAAVVRRHLELTEAPDA